MNRAHVIHHLPGRVRVKLPHAKGNPVLLQRVKESLSPLPGVKRVDVNSTTGSVLVHYDPGMHEDYENHLAIHAEREELFTLRPPELTEADEIVNKIEVEAEFLAEHSEAARSVVNFVKQLNEVIKQETNNNVDLKVLLPLGLAVYTFFEVGTDSVTPLWVTLGIFSFNSFISLHHPKTRVHMDQHEVVFDKSSQTISSKKAVKHPANRKTKKHR